MQAARTFTDIHSHILAGVDDGAKDRGQSIAMARAYVAAGFQHVFATPHHIPGTAWAQPAKEIIQKVRELQTCFQENKIPLVLYPGMEIALHYHLLKEYENNQLLPLGNSNCYLLEPPFQLFRDDLLEVLLSFKKTGKCVILAHPERIPYFQKKTDLLFELIRKGIMLQVNAGSLLGKFGERTKKTALILAEKNSIHFVASDTHGHEMRTPPTRKELHLLKGILTKNQLQTVFLNNPEKLLGKS